MAAIIIGNINEPQDNAENLIIQIDNNSEKG